MSGQHRNRNGRKRFSTSERLEHKLGQINNAGRQLLDTKKELSKLNVLLTGEKKVTCDFGVSDLCLGESAVGGSRAYSDVDPRYGSNLAYVYRYRAESSEDGKERAACWRCRQVILDDLENEGEPYRLGLSKRHRRLSAEEASLREGIRRLERETSNLQRRSEKLSALRDMRTTEKEADRAEAKPKPTQVDKRDQDRNGHREHRATGHIRGVDQLRLTNLKDGAAGQPIVSPQAN